MSMVRCGNCGLLTAMADIRGGRCGLELWLERFAAELRSTAAASVDRDTEKKDLSGALRKKTAEWRNRRTSVVWAKAAHELDELVALYGVQLNA